MCRSPLEQCASLSPCCSNACSMMCQVVESKQAAEVCGYGLILGLVQVYTLRTHSIVQTLHFSSRVLSVRASCRLLIVALDAQVGEALTSCQWALPQMHHSNVI